MKSSDRFRSRAADNLVERETRCVVAWAVCEARTPELMQSVVDAAPHARSYDPRYPALRTAMI